MQQVSTLPCAYCKWRAAGMSGYQCGWQTSLSYSNVNNQVGSSILLHQNRSSHQLKWKCTGMMVGPWVIFRPTRQLVRSSNKCSRRIESVSEAFALALPIGQPSVTFDKAVWPRVSRGCRWLAGCVNHFKFCMFITCVQWCGSTAAGWSVSVQTERLYNPALFATASCLVVCSALVQQWRDIALWSA